MESNVRGGRFRSRCLETKRVPGRSRLMFRYHKATNRKKGRERERETNRKVPTQININKIEIIECDYNVVNTHL